MPQVQVVDHVARCVSELSEDRFGVVSQATRLDQVVAVRVRYNGIDRGIWVHDDKRRPPEPGAFWLDDLVSAACRRLFGASRGHVRSVAAHGGQLEFREVWPEPAAWKVHEKVPVTCLGGPGQPDRKDVLIVQASCLPGAERESVILAAATAACDRKFGPGQTAMVGSAVVHDPGNPTRNAETVKYHHAVCRKGGQAVAVVTEVPRRLAASWPNVFAAVEANCRKRFGPGTLKYEPELGETVFTFTA